MNLLMIFIVITKRVVTMESFINFKISRNAQLIVTIVMTMPTVLTPKDHFTAHVTMATLEMESHVMVSIV